MITKKGFVIIIVLAFLAILSILAVIIVSFGFGELTQTNTRNDFERAYYLAISGAQMQYLYYTEQGVTDLAEQEVVLDSSTEEKGYFDPIAYPSAQNGEVDIVSRGYVNKGSIHQHTVTIVAKYPQSPSIASINTMTFAGHRIFIFTSRVFVNESVGTNTPPISTNQYVSLPEYRKVPNPGLTPLSFWMDADGNPKTVYDTNGNGDFITDRNGDGQVTIDDAIAMAAGDPALEMLYRGYFMADNVYHPGGGTTFGPINALDAFYQYYTNDLNYKDPLNPLGINPGGVNYYSGDQTFGPWSVPNDKKIIFVDGNVDIWFNAQNWGGGAKDLTIVSTRNVNLDLPLNGSDDRLTLITYNNVSILSLSFFSMDGDLVVQANNDFIANWGGKTNGSMFANNRVTVDTGIVSALFTRTLKKEKFDRSDPGQWPLGLHPNYPKPKPPKWQRPV